MCFCRIFFFFINCFVKADLEKVFDFFSSPFPKLLRDCSIVFEEEKKKQLDLFSPPCHKKFLQFLHFFS